MAYSYNPSSQQQQQQQQQGGGYGAANNLQFYPSQYGAPVSGHTTPAQASYGGSPYGGGASAQAYGQFGGAQGFGAGVSGNMGTQGGLTTGWLAAFGTEGYEGEPPLLEELGVNFEHIKVKTLAVLNPFARIDQHIMDDSDLFGPIIFCLLFGTFMLLSGKVNFGYIYGLAAIGSVSLHVIFSLMSNPALDTAGSGSGINSPPYNQMGQMGGMGSDPADHGPNALTFFRSCSVLGYCLLPLVIISLLGVVVPMDSALGYMITSGAVAWCTYSSSGIFCAVGRMRSMRPLVAYPLMLFYVGFGIMGIFSSRGSGQLAAKAAGL